MKISAINFDSTYAVSMKSNKQRKTQEVKNLKQLTNAADCLASQNKSMVSFMGYSDNYKKMLEYRIEDLKDEIRDIEKEMDYIEYNMSVYDRSSWGSFNNKLKQKEKELQNLQLNLRILYN